MLLHGEKEKPEKDGRYLYFVLWKAPIYGGKTHEFVTVGDAYYENGKWNRDYLHAWAELPTSEEMKGVMDESEPRDIELP